MTASCASRASPAAPTAAHGRRANPVRAASAASATDVDVGVRSSRRRVAAASIAACTVGEQPAARPRQARRAPAAVFSPVSRRTSVTCPAARSRGPSSTRSGAPLISHSVTRRPNDRPSRGVDPHPHARAAQRLRHLLGDVQSEASARTGNTTTCAGATAGGTSRPASSPCPMISPPTIRVDEPHDVVQANSRSPDGSRKSIPNARAKFCPSSWLVASCRALPSPIMASQVIVLTAPANRSLSVLCPTSTGRARRSTRKSR